MLGETSQGNFLDILWAKITAFIGPTSDNTGIYLILWMTEALGTFVSLFMIPFSRIWRVLTWLHKEQATLKVQSWPVGPIWIDFDFQFGVKIGKLILYFYHMFWSFPELGQTVEKKWIWWKMKDSSRWPLGYLKQNQCWEYQKEFWAFVDWNQEVGN